MGSTVLHYNFLFNYEKMYWMFLNPRMHLKGMLTM